MSNGFSFQDIDLETNALVDKLAKEAAIWDAVSVNQRKLVLHMGVCLTAIAKWIGQCGVLANHFKLPHLNDSEKCIFIRDSEGMSTRKTKPDKRKHEDVVPIRAAGDFSGCPRWEAIRQRIIDKQGSI